MNEQERKIIALLLNQMAFEGAERHFKETPPEIPVTYLSEIERIEIPQKYDGNSESYHFVKVQFDEGSTTYTKCFRYLSMIRNNIIHANKAFKPDTPKRLEELLNWAGRFIEAVYKTDSSFAIRAREIKAVMKIESF